MTLNITVPSLVTPKFTVGDEIFFLDHDCRSMTVEELEHLVDCGVCAKTRKITLSDGKEYRCPACAIACNRYVNVVEVMTGRIDNVSSNLDWQCVGSSDDYVLEAIVNYGVQLDTERSYPHSIDKYVYEDSVFATEDEAMAAALVKNNAKEEASP